MTHIYYIIYKREREGDQKMGDSPMTPERHGKSLMDDLLGLLRIRVKRGVNLAVRDVNTSDPYVVVRMGKQVGLFSSLFLSHFIF